MQKESLIYAVDNNLCSRVNFFWEQKKAYAKNKIVSFFLKVFAGGFFLILMNFENFFFFLVVNLTKKKYRNTEL